MYIHSGEIIHKCRRRAILNFRKELFQTGLNCLFLWQSYTFVKAKHLPLSAVVIKLPYTFLSSYSNMNTEEKNKNVTFLRHKIAGLLKYQYFCYLSYLGIWKNYHTQGISCYYTKKFWLYHTSSAPYFCKSE